MMQATDLAALVCATAITLVTGAVILLRPLARRLPELLELMIEQRRRPAGGERSDGVGKRLLALEARLELMAERQGIQEAISVADRRTESSGPLPVHGRRSFGQ